MDKVFSARIDETAIAALTRAAKQLGMTKKELLESAILSRVRELDETAGTDLWEETSGAWARDEPPESTRRRSRKAFQRSFRRHHTKGR